MTRVVRVRFEKGVLKPLEPLDLSEGEEVLVEIKEDIIEYARRIRKLINTNEEPSEVLSRERERFCFGYRVEGCY
ncbi:antitoxin family protein [Ignisphaera sp. 4213-co]|uniref:Antitoxin n=1 Tax=Ignisphaera cupida TaxID=3050454 RepID=A0ABD4Z7N9_9CREN|nr:antitoxin family protein [Ignisphaera sp. 4213-co]MDK6028890.1 antitoxin family protein [Ignisphaera sp. 4213-co]